MTNRLLPALATFALGTLALATITSGPAAAADSAPATLAVVARIPAGDGSWDFANVDPANGKLYVARGDGITAVDLTKGKVVDRLAPANRGHQVLVLDGGKTVFETDGGTGLARFIAADTGAVLAEVPTGKKPDAALLDPATGLLAVMNAGDGTIALLDPASRTLKGTIAVGGGLEFGVADGTGKAYVNIEDQAVIARVDLKAGKKLGTIALPGCEGPTGLALVGKGSRLITACANGTALVINPASGKVVAKLPIGTDPDAVLTDEARGLAYIPCGGTGTLVVLDIANPAAIAVREVVPTQNGAKTGAVDPRTGKVYLPTAILAPVEPGAKRGKPIPATFAILVVAPTGS